MGVERSYRGITVRLAVTYLENLGGEVIEQSDDLSGVEGKATVAGAGWRATLDATRVSIGPSLSLTEVRVVFEGDDLDGLIEAFSRKAMRAGG